jgi:hypothetical protein
MILKKSYEEFFRYHEFKRDDGNGWLGDSETILAATVTAKERDTGMDVSASMISDVAPYNNTQVEYKLKAGTAGKIYVLTIQVATSTGQKFEDSLEAGVV